MHIEWRINACFQRWNFFTSRVFLPLKLFYFLKKNDTVFLAHQYPLIHKATERALQRINTGIKKVAPLETTTPSKSEKNPFVYPYLAYFDIQQPSKRSSHNFILITFIMVMHITIKFLGWHLQSKPSCRQAFSSLIPCSYFLLVPEKLIFLPTIWLLKAL